MGMSVSPWSKALKLVTSVRAHTDIVRGVVRRCRLTLSNPS